VHKVTVICFILSVFSHITAFVIAVLGICGQCKLVTYLTTCSLLLTVDYLLSIVGLLSNVSVYELVLHVIISILTRVNDY